MIKRKNRLQGLPRERVSDSKGKNVPTCQVCGKKLLNGDTIVKYKHRTYCSSKHLEDHLDMQIGLSAQFV